MNKQRRKHIRKCVDELKCISGKISSIASDEQCAMEQIPASFQESERYYQMAEIVETLEFAADEINSIVEDISEI